MSGLRLSDLNKETTYLLTYLHLAVVRAVSGDQRYPRQRHRSLSGTLAPCCADSGVLWWRPYTGLDLPHRASASRYVAAATVHGRTCAFHWRGVQRRQVPATVCQWQTSVHQRVPRCSSPPGLWQKRGQVSLRTRRPV